jgi:hypothetical protein
MAPDACFIYNKFSAIQDSHLVVCIEEFNNLEGDSSKLKLIYQFLIVVANELRSREACTLTDINKELEAKGLISQNRTLSVASCVNQLVFFAIGWLTMLYDPCMEPRTDMLELENFIRTSAAPLNTRILYSFSQNFASIEHPLHTLLCSFGNIIPLANRSISQGSQPLGIRYLNYFTLSRVAMIRVEWVDALSLHLDFNEALKVLKIFRFPSFCRMLYSREEKSFLDQ